MEQQGEVRQPPQAPEIERRIILTRLHLVGLPILILIPVLALAGAFGLDRDRQASSGDVLEVEVEYPSLARLRASGTLDIEVRNVSGGPLDALTVRIDRAYLEGFGQVAFTPAADSLSDESYRFDLGTVRAGESRAVSADMRPRKYWRRPGTVTVSAEGVEGIAIDFSTFVFP